MKKKKTTKTHLVLQKFLFSIIILLVYLVGRELPLYGIDLTSNMLEEVNSQMILLQVISGDLNRCSVLALGISPYMMASIIVQGLASMKGSNPKARWTPIQTNRIMLAVMTVFAIGQALMRVGELDFRFVGGWPLLEARILATVELIAGAYIILWLSDRNKCYGIGGQSLLIFVNVLEGLRASVMGHRVQELLLPGAVSVGVALIVIFLENTEFRIPVQRISIHNIYADKNYLAIKLTPIGVMPAMFASACFMIPQLLVALLSKLFAQCEWILWTKEQLSLLHPLGIGVYIAILYLLSIVFSMVFISPRDTAERFARSGDSIVNLHAGKETKRYLTRKLLFLSLFSATIMAICLGVPMILQLYGKFSSSLVMLPASVMMLVGIFCSLYQEVVAIHKFDQYKPII